MRLNYNITGIGRKRLVHAISEILGDEAKYLRTPTYAYQVGEYHIDKNGVVTGPQDNELEADLRARGFEISVEEAAIDTEAETDANEALSADDETEPQTSMDETTEAATGETQSTSEAQMDEPKTEPAIPTIKQDSDRFTVEMPLGGFDKPDKLDNLRKMVDAKTTLLKAALGADSLPIQVTEDTIQFPWFSADGILTGGAEVEAYTTLISLLCKRAIEKKRITAKEKDIEGSPKYALRCFLLSLGMIGSEYKTTRKILLSKMEGNGSWKTGNGKRAVEETAPEAETAEITSTDGEFDETAAGMNSEAELLADAELIHAVNETFNDEE